jgi:hypothetical protein
VKLSSSVQVGNGFIAVPHAPKLLHQSDFVEGQFYPEGIVVIIFSHQNEGDLRNRARADALLWSRRASVEVDALRRISRSRSGIHINGSDCSGTCASGYRVNAPLHGIGRPCRRGLSLTTALRIKNE